MPETEKKTYGQMIIVRAAHGGFAVYFRFTDGQFLFACSTIEEALKFIKGHMRP